MRLVHRRILPQGLVEAARSQCPREFDTSLFLRVDQRIYLGAETIAAQRLEDHQ